MGAFSLGCENFSGTDDQSVEDFLQELDSYCDSTGLIEDKEKVSCLRSHVKKDANSKLLFF